MRAKLAAIVWAFERVIARARRRALRSDLLDARLPIGSDCKSNGTQIRL